MFDEYGIVKHIWYTILRSVIGKDSSGWRADKLEQQQTWVRSKTRWVWTQERRMGAVLKEKGKCRVRCYKCEWDGVMNGGGIIIMQGSERRKSKE